MEQHASKSDLIDLIRKSGVSLIFKVFGGLSAFLTTLILGRILGTSGSGLFFLSLAIVTVVSAISRLGFDQAITRFISEARVNEDWQRVNGLYRFAMTRVLLASVAMSLLLFATTPFLCEVIFRDPELIPVLRWMSLSIVGFAITWLHSHFFQGMDEIKTFQVFQNLGLISIFLTVLGILFVFQSNRLADPETYAICFFAASVCASVLAHATWRSRHSWYAWNAPLVGDAQWVQVLLPFLGILILNQLNTWLPQILLGTMGTSEEVGVFNAAFRVANLTSLVLIGVNSVVFPKFAALHSTGQHDRLKALAQNSAKMMSVACLPFLIVLLCFPTHVLRLFGEGFESGSVVLQIAAIGQLVNVLTGSVGGLLSMTGHQNAVARCSLISFAIMIAVSLLLIPPLGLIGAALAQSAGLISNMVLLTITSRKSLGFAPVGGSKART